MSVTLRGKQEFDPLKQNYPAGVTTNFPGDSTLKCLQPAVFDLKEVRSVHFRRLRHLNT